MKLHITVKQLKGLSDKGKRKLQKWWKPKSGDWYVCPDFEDEDIKMDICLMDENLNGLENYHHKGSHLPLLSIGQMIEFLARQDRDEKCMCVNWKDIRKFNDYLCDSLWEATKEILEK